jgi:hypothetical protein
MRIGKLAKLSGVTVRTIRYYIEEGLLPPPPTRGKYGDFDESYLPRLQLILKLKEERLTIQAIRERLVEMGVIEAGAGEREDEGGLFRSRFAEEAGLTSIQVARLESLGLLESREGLLPVDAVPLAKAASYLLDRGASLEDLAAIIEQIRREVSMHQDLLAHAGAEDFVSRVLLWQAQVGAVNTIREILLTKWGQQGGEEV